MLVPPYHALASQGGKTNTKSESPAPRLPHAFECAPTPNALPPGPQNVPHYSDPNHLPPNTAQNYSNPQQEYFASSQLQPPLHNPVQGGSYSPQTHAPYASQPQQPYHQPSSPQAAYYPSPSQPTHRPQAHPDGIDSYKIDLSSVNTELLDNPSIPRLFPRNVADDMNETPKTVPYIEHVNRKTLRPTVQCLPNSPALSDTFGLPVGLNLSPFAEEQLPEVDFNDKGGKMIRCKKCSAYINPFTTFCDSGRRWQCILCRQINEVSRDYYCELDLASGIRRDIMERTELRCCSVDIIPTTEFTRTPPRQPIFVLQLDLSYQAVSSGLLRAICKGVLSALETMKEEDALYMGVIGFDTTVYFFNLHPSLEAPRMLVSPDTVSDSCQVNDKFTLDPIELPCPVNELIVPVKDSYHLLKELFEKLPQKFGDTKEVGCAFGPAIAASASMLEKSGGKIIASIASIPSHGDGKLKARLGSKKGDLSVDQSLCLSANDWYKKRSLACSNSSISIDLVASDGTEIDLATVAPLARYTSGTIVFASALTLGGISAQVEHMLLRFTAFDCILRVRTSNGLVVPNFFGHCHVREPDLLSLPIATNDLSFGVELRLTNTLKENFAYVQFALVYTNRARQRRIRVHTYQLNASPTIGSVMNSINSIGMSVFLAKMAVDHTTSNSFAKTHQWLSDKLINALRVAKKQLEAQGVYASAGQLLIPTSMRFIPQFIISLTRNPALIPLSDRTITPDRRVAMMATIITSPPEPLIPYNIAWIYQIYSPYLPINQLPMPICASSTLFSRKGIYLCNIGTTIILWCGKNSPASVLHFFGINNTESAESLDLDSIGVQREELLALRERVEELVRSFKQFNSRAFCSTLEVCMQGDHTFEHALDMSMIEDRYKNSPSYSSFLKDIAAQLQQKSK